MSSPLDEPRRDPQRLSGDFFGLAATGKRATIRVMDFVRHQNGRIAEHWNIVELPGLQAQLGN